MSRPSAGLSVCLCGVAIALSAALPTSAHGADPERIDVAAVVPWGDPFGYTPVLVTIDSGVDREIAVEASCGDIEARATVSVRAGIQRVETVLLPPTLGSGTGCQVGLKWRTDDGRTGQERHIYPRNFNVEELVIGTSSGGYPEPLRPKLIPDRWQAFPLRALVRLEPGVHGDLTAAQKAALVAWSQGGGKLVVADDDREVWLEAAARLPRVGDDTTAGHEPWERRFRPDLVRVPGTEEVPIGGFMLLVVLFAIIVGPLNIWWVIKQNKRHLFLLTTPLVSLITCGLLIGYNILSEGLHIRRVVGELTYLDVERKAAVSYHATTFFAGVSVDDLTVGLDAKVLPMNPEEHDLIWAEGWMDEEPGARSLANAAISWTATAQHLTGGWIPARRNRQLTFIQRRSERRRVTVEKDGNDYRILNGLGTRITWLEWTDSAGGVWLAEHIDDGQGAVLRSMATRRSSDVELSRFGRGAMSLWTTGEPRDHFHAQLDAPLEASPGPDAEDSSPPVAYLTGPLRLAASAGAEPASGGAP